MLWVHPRTNINYCWSSISMSTVTLFSGRTDIAYSLVESFVEPPFVIAWPLPSNWTIAVPDRLYRNQNLTKYRLVHVVILLFFEIRFRNFDKLLFDYGCLCYYIWVMLLIPFLNENIVWNWSLSAIIVNITIFITFNIDYYCF